MLRNSHRLLLSLILVGNIGVACAQALTFAISEGTSGGLDHAQVLAKYEGLAQVIAKGAKQKVNLVFVREFSALEEGMKTDRFDLVMARPSDYPARGLRDYGYQFVASANPQGQCFVVVSKNSTLSSLSQVKGKRLVMPETVSYMSKFCKAEMRDKGIFIDKENVQFVREQAAVTFYLDNGFADVGFVASYSGAAKKWEKDGNKILHKSVPQPYFPMVASKRIKAPVLAAIKSELEKLEAAPAGEELLKRVGVKGFDTQTEARLRELLPWLEK